MSKKENWKSKYYDQSQYDNNIFFRDYIQTILQKDFKVLDAGAGAGEKFEYHYKDQVQELIGADLDPRVEQNPQVHKGFISDLTETPFEDNYFDLTFNRYVLEHIAEPEKFLMEMNRITKPGGLMVFITPNKWHYVSLIARCTPQRFHEWVNKKRGRDEDDTFPTVYHLNSKRDLDYHFKNNGFQNVEINMIECCPNYLTFSYPTFLLGVLYERVVNSSELFSGLRVNLIGTYKKIKHVTT